tara:strand:+ start:409 stop:1266 length:858 start_codon:yes stop_codon:yes gene_type:complete
MVLKYYSKQISRRYRNKQTARQKKKQGRYGNINFNKIQSDVLKLKKMLNTEHKMVATNFGTADSNVNPSIRFRPANFIEATQSTPTIKQIGYPVKGTANYERVGNSIKAVSLSVKVNTRFLFPSIGSSADDSQRLLNPYVDIYLMLRKSSSTQAGTAVPEITELFYPDSNGGYNSQCFRRKETLNQFTVLDKKRLTAKMQSSLLSGESGIGFRDDKYCTLAYNKPLYFKWTPGSSGGGIPGSYSECQNGMLFILVMSNCISTESASLGQTTAKTFAQFQMTYVDN